MVPKTQPYRNQHAELARLAAAVPSDPAEVVAPQALRALDCLKSVLIVHVSLQDGMLYPWMLHRGDELLRQKASEHRALMRGFLIIFLDFYQTWRTPDAIEDNRELFVLQWKRVAALMRRRLSAEVSDLYRVIDAQEERLDCQASFRRVVA